jgi:hypothetical protein
MLLGSNPTGRLSTSARKVAIEPWLAVERASNGYIVRDTAAREIWLVADDDWLDAAAGLLHEMNGRLGSAGDGFEERRVKVAIEPGEQWLAANPSLCRHTRVRNTSQGASGVWACICGVEFVPIQRSAEMKAAA